VPGPAVVGVQLNVQLAPPVAGAHVAPLSTLTSTAPTEPPPTSTDVPLTLIVLFVGTTAPSSGKPIVETGGERSPVAVLATRPGWIVVGSAPISANRLSVACCIAGVGGSLPRS
jgi:hypothetical protein